MSRSAAASDSPFVARGAGISSEQRRATSGNRSRATSGNRSRATSGNRSRAAIAEMVASPLASVGFLVRAWAGIFVVEASLRVVGYKRTLRWIERVPPRNVHPHDVRRSFPRTSVHLGERLVRKAYLAHVLPGGCLPRSLVQYLLHRRDGTGAKLVVGVRRPDRSGSTSGATSGNPSRANETATPGIEAHAWVESDASAPIGVEGFAPIFSSGDSG